MAAVNNILETKGSVIFSIPPETSVYHALDLMVEKNVSAWKTDVSGGIEKVTLPFVSNILFTAAINF